MADGTCKEHEPQLFCARPSGYPDIGQLDVYAQHGGYESPCARRSRTMPPEQVTDRSVQSLRLARARRRGLSHRLKWSFYPQGYFPTLCHGECGRVRARHVQDRSSLEKNPHQLMKATALCAYAVRGGQGLHLLPGEFAEPAPPFKRRLTRRIELAIWAKTFSAGFNMTSRFTSARAPTSAAKDGVARIARRQYRSTATPGPPFPAVAACTPSRPSSTTWRRLSNIPYIVANGRDGYRKFGTEKIARH